MSTKFVTAPDKLHPEDPLPNILIMDAEWSDIENLGLMCMQKNINVNFYIFGPTSIDYNWLAEAANISEVTLVNSESDRHHDAKDQLTNVVKFGSNEKIVSPVEYIIQHTTEDK